MTELERIVLSIYVRQNCPGGQCKRMRRVTSEKNGHPAEYSVRVKDADGLSLAGSISNTFDV